MSESQTYVEQPARTGTEPPDEYGPACGVAVTLGNPSAFTVDGLGVSIKAEDMPKRAAERGPRGSKSRAWRRRNA